MIENQTKVFSQTDVGNNLIKHILKINNQTKLVNILGIGAFTFLSISDFTGLIEFMLEIFLIIIKSDSKSIFWIPKLINIIIFSTILICIINKTGKLTELGTRKSLVKIIIIYFGIMLLYFLFSFLNSGFLAIHYSTAFQIHYDSTKDNYESQKYASFIPIFKELIFAVILLMKRKTIANS